MTFQVLSETQTRLWDFGWFNVSEFVVEGTLPHSEPREILRAFLADPNSRKWFCTRPDPWGESLETHGPYNWSYLRPEWYEQITFTDLAKRIELTFEDPEFTSPPPVQQQTAVRKWSESIAARGDTLWELKDPADPVARVEFDFFSVFVEFVGVSPDRRILTVAVIGYD